MQSLISLYGKSLSRRHLSIGAPKKQIHQCYVKTNNPNKINLHIVMHIHFIPAMSNLNTVE